MPAGLQSHMNEHGAAAMPYDCNMCTAKFFFRSELEHHLIDHESGRLTIASVPMAAVPPVNDYAPPHISSAIICSKPDNEHNGKVMPKTECTEDEEEYIEIEKVVDTTTNGVDDLRIKEANNKSCEA